MTTCRIEQARADHPSLQRDQRVAIIARQITDFSGGQNRVEKVMITATQVSEVEETFDHRQRGARDRVATGCVVDIQQRFSHALVSEKKARSVSSEWKVMPRCVL